MSAGELLIEDMFICIQNADHNRLASLMESNITTYVSPEQFQLFTEMFSRSTRRWVDNSINIHGMGGSSFAKPNLTSIACLYLSSLSNIKIAKTGSRRNTSIFGSTDFFEQIGLLRISDKQAELENFGFAYFDYLELSPWKRYKNIIGENIFINEILNSYHFFEYKIDVLGLGVSSRALYKKYLSQNHYPNPNRQFTYSTVINGVTVDEVISPSFGDDNQFPKYLSVDEISRINWSLISGDDIESVWYSSLRSCVASFACELNLANSVDEGLVLFDQAYRDKVVSKKISNILTVLGE